MKVSMFGLGSFGAVSLARFARDGHHGIGVYVDSTKLAAALTFRATVSGFGG